MSQHRVVNEYVTEERSRIECVCGEIFPSAQEYAEHYMLEEAGSVLAWMGRVTAEMAAVNKDLSRLAAELEADGVLGGESHE